jgi:hypothetical protein
MWLHLLEFRGRRKMIGFFLVSFIIGVVVGIGVARYAWSDFYNEWKLLEEFYDAHVTVSKDVEDDE